MGVQRQPRFGCPSHEHLHLCVAFFPLRLRGPRIHSLPRGYPRSPETLGQHLRKRRLDLGLLQRDLAARLGVGVMTVGNWELGKEQPGIRHTAAILAFLGYDPEPAGDSLPGRLRDVRRHHGLTQAELAARLGQDEHQICRWEGGRQRPHPWIASQIELGLRALEGRPVDGAHSQISFFDLTRWRRRLTRGLAAAQPTTLGERIRETRLRLGMSQDEAGRLFGVSRAVVYRWERGSLPVSASKLAAIRSFLERRPLRRLSD